MSILFLGGFLLMIVVVYAFRDQLRSKRRATAFSFGAGAAETQQPLRVAGV